MTSGNSQTISRNRSRNQLLNLMMSFIYDRLKLLESSQYIGRILIFCVHRNYDVWGQFNAFIASLFNLIGNYRRLPPYEPVMI